jgi:hypothetical protein
VDAVRDRIAGAENLAEDASLRRGGNLVPLRLRGGDRAPGRGRHEQASLGRQVEELFDHVFGAHPLSAERCDCAVDDLCSSAGNAKVFEETTQGYHFGKRLGKGSSIDYTATRADGVATSRMMTAGIH